MFERFWRLYPRKVDKGRALTQWNKLCTKPKRPTLKVILQAIRGQKGSERWQTPKFIPHPTTWLNQSRWLDDPKEMKSFTPNNERPARKMEDGQWWYKGKDGLYWNEDNKLLRE